MSFIADRVVMDGLTFDDVLLIPATFRATASKFSKVAVSYTHLTLPTNSLV